jgi:hypothetical protein
VRCASTTAFVVREPAIRAFLRIAAAEKLEVLVTNASSNVAAPKAALSNAFPEVRMPCGDEYSVGGEADLVRRRHVDSSFFAFLV